jgi:hypothetical protein
VSVSGTGLAGENELAARPDSCDDSYAYELDGEAPGGLEDKQPKEVLNGGADQSFALGMPTAGAAGVKACWRASATAGWVTVGTLTLNGPNSQDYTCTLGAACDVTITGTGLDQAANKVVTTSPDGCDSGTASWANAAAVASGGTASAPEYAVGTPRVGGEYRVCWSVGTDTAQYVDVGKLQVIGPISPQDFDCTAGWPCEIELEGHGLDGTRDLAYGENCANSPTVITRDGDTAEGLLAGKFKLCWGPGMVNIGVVRVHAAREGAYICTLGSKCRIRLRSAAGPTPDAFIRLTREPRCGEGAEPAPWAPVVTKVGEDVYEIPDPGELGGIGADTHRVCWRPIKADEPLFPVDASGAVKLVGPRPVEAMCTRGLPCYVKLQGHGLTTVVKQAVTRVVESRASRTQCGAGAVRALNFRQIAVTPDGVGVVMGDLRMNPSGSFTMCWGRAGHPQNVLAGTLGVLGPNLDPTWQCMLGLECPLEGLLGRPAGFFYLLKDGPWGGGCAGMPVPWLQPNPFFGACSSMGRFPQSLTRWRCATSKCASCWR